MKEIDKIFDCNNIEVIKNNLFTSIKKDTFINNILIGDNDLFYSLYEYNENIYCYSNSTLYQIIENKLVEVFHKKEFDSFYIIKNNYILLYKRISRKELYYELCDFNNTIYWSQTADQFISVYSDFLRVNDRLNLDQFIIKDVMNNFLWEFIPPIGFSIFGHIQIIDNILFFTACKNVNEAMIVYGIDIRTGQVRWELHYQIPYDSDFVAIHINKEDNLCYGYGGKLYQVFDPIKGEIILTKDMSEYYNQGISPILFTNTLSDGRLWFVSGRGEKTKFGALNVKTSEIEFIQDYPLENDDQLGKPVYHQGKLYLKDDSNVLHIFE